MIQEATSLQGLPLSPQQRRLWQLCPSPSFHPYRSACVVEIAGDLDPGALQVALEVVARRHEILRTSFHVLPGMPYPLQVIGDALPRLASLSSGAGTPLDQLLAEWQTAAADDADGPEPLRAAVACLGSGRHLLLLGLPALCGDGASLDNLTLEIARAYGRGEMTDPFQYADLAAWNNEILTLEESAEGKSFWRRAAPADGLEAALPFSLRSPGAELPAGFTPRTVALSFPGDLAAHASAVAEQSGAPPEVGLEAVLLAVWQLLLGLVADREELVLGVVRGGRKYEEMVAALGPYARCLPLACAPGEGPFTSLVRRVGASLRELDDWQEYFDWDLAAGGARAAALPFAFELTDVRPPAEAGGLTFTMARRHCWSERFEVMLRVQRYRREVTSLGADLVYDAGLLGHADVERLGRWYETLLRNALAAPESRVGDLEILGGAERQRTLVEWNATGTDSGPAGTLWERVAERAARDPHGTALEWDGGEMTRAELIDRASRLASHLRRLGIGPEVRVAVAVERSPEMVVSLLGVLAAGGAYVPLDPDYPQERLDRMLEDAGAAVLLTRQALAGRFPEGRFRVVCLDRLELEAGEWQGPGAAPDDLAYVIYTSGSTGRPKGVMISHRAILNRLLWMQRRFPLGADDRVLQKTPYSFDASVWEIFVPLIAGARLLLAEPGGQRDNSYLLETIARRGVTVLQLVPSQLSVFLEQEGIFDGCAGLRRLF
ncbi:MAG TPA: AMP-binding protein, partial [Thermoanaerobaculia bacterium]|nr:AMP-binding protein [Thermoanaerobaculia bacterium]